MPQPIRYLDIVFVAYGQVRSDEFGFHAGGCTGEYVDELWPILQRCGVSLLVFGHPNMVDIGKVDAIVGAIELGTLLDDLQSQLKYPQGLKYFAAGLAPAEGGS